MVGPFRPLAPWPMGGAFHVHEDRDAFVEGRGNLEEVPVPGVALAAFNALEGAPVDAGHLCEGLLAVASRSA